jgi:spermidine/putrescine-binding protein
VTVLDSSSEVIGAALKMRGHSYNDSSSEHLAVARGDLLRLKPYLRAFETSYKPLREHERRYDLFLIHADPTEYRWAHRVKYQAGESTKAIRL